MVKDKIKNKKVDMLSIQGASVGELELSGNIFGIEPNIHVMHLALKRQLNNARQGSACTKTRAEVSGGGKKPWKQKGTGRARAGSLRSPLFAGGGVIFGPKPRSYETSLPKKARQLALRSALSARFENLIVVDDFSALTEPKTKTMVKILSDIKAAGKILIIADFKAENNKNLELSARNLPNVKLLLPTNLSVKDLIEADCVVIEKEAINVITERLS
ncbi:MAG: 50S ribosomal protein L4 [Cyanobacteria bacterium SIG30]|nr:50S ribosomal protein L4 [Cyanobacteria bacterium SIG30]